MDDVDEKLVEAQDFLAVDKVGSIDIRHEHTDQLEREYVRWGMRLADILGAPIYPFSQRYKGKVGTVQAGSIPVRH